MNNSKIQEQSVYLGWNKNMNREPVCAGMLATSREAREFGFFCGCFDN